MRRNHATSGGEFIEIDAGLDAHSVQHIYDVFGRDIARCARGVRAAPEPSNRAVDDGDSQLKGSEDIRERLAPRVMEMDGELRDRYLRRNGLNHVLSFERSADADGIAEGNFIAAHLVEFARDIADGLKERLHLHKDIRERRRRSRGP